MLDGSGTSGLPVKGAKRTGEAMLSGASSCSSAVVARVWKKGERGGDKPAEVAGVESAGELLVLKSEDEEADDEEWEAKAGLVVAGIRRGAAVRLVGVNEVSLRCSTVGSKLSSSCCSLLPSSTSRTERDEATGRGRKERELSAKGESWIRLTD